METITTEKQLSDCIKSFGIKHFSCYPTFYTIEITFYNFHWYSFILKRRIAKLKHHLPLVIPLSILVEYKLSNTKG